MCTYLQNEIKGKRNIFISVRIRRPRRPTTVEAQRNGQIVIFQVFHIRNSSCAHYCRYIGSSSSSLNRKEDSCASSSASGKFINIRAFHRGHLSV